MLKIQLFKVKTKLVQDLAVIKTIKNSGRLVYTNLPELS